MKKELIITAKTVEEARAKAAAEFGVAEEELEFTVLEEAKRGFLGLGASDAKVQAVYTVKGAELALERLQKQDCLLVSGSFYIMNDILSVLNQ